MIDIFAEVVSMQKDGLAGVLISVVDKKNRGPAVIGSKLLVRSDGKMIGTVGGGELEHKALELSRELIQKKYSCLQRYNLDGDCLADSLHELNMLCGGVITLFYDYIPVKPSIYIFGAGHIGQSLAFHFSNLDYRVNILDNRNVYLDRIATEGHLVSKWDEAVNRINLDEAYIIICTPSHEADYVVLKALYSSDWSPHYIGLVASPAKAQSMVARLKKEMAADPDLGVLYSPAGLDIGGKAPGDIAISIISEIQSVRYQIDMEEVRHLRLSW